LELLSGVDVFGVLPEDDHVDLLGLLHGAGDPRVPADRAEADVQVEDLPQGDVQAAEALPHRCGERTLDADEMALERLDGLVGQPVAGLVVGLLPGEDLLPDDAALTAVRLLDGGVEDADRRRPDVRPRAIPLDERDDRLVGDLQAVGPHADDLGHCSAPVVGCCGDPTQPGTARARPGRGGRSP
jgi:hypothetical protein